MTTKPTPKTFSPHVLVALALAADWTPNKAVAMRDVFPTIFSRMGITEEQYGTISTGRLQTHQWIGIAFRKLKLRGVTDQKGRGNWTITAEGIAEARELVAAEGGDAPTAVKAPVTPTADNLLAEVTAAAEASVAPTEAPATLTVETTETEAAPDNLVELRRPDARAYHEDGFIRSQAIGATKCFGYHSSRARACKTCPLAAECVQAVRAEYARISQEIEAERVKAERSARAKARVKQAASEGVRTDDLLDELDEAVGAVTGNRRTTKKSTTKRKSKAKWDKTKAMPIKARNNPTCASCSKTIPNGDQCLWIENGGTFHKDCL